MKLSAWICICVAFIACSQTKKTTKIQSRLVRDTVFVQPLIVDIVPGFVRTDSLLAESIKSNQQIFSKLGEEKQKDNWDKAATIIQGVALGSLIIGFIAYIYERRKRNMEFLSSINSIMIEHPELRFYKDFNRANLKNILSNFVGTLVLKFPFDLEIKAPYDITIKNKIDLIINDRLQNISPIQSFNSNNNQHFLKLKSDQQIDLEIDIKKSDLVILYSNVSDDNYTKIRAYCYYILNNFETVLNDWSWRFKKGWINYFKSLYLKSSDFKTIVDDAIDNESVRIQFTSSFIKKLKKFRNQIKKKISHPNSP
ncbi:MAG: hypothetical protein ACXWCT_12295 [Flavitalea sp.]